MKVLFVPVLLFGCLQAQTPAASPAVNPVLHADTVKLVEASGARQRLAEVIEPSLKEARKAMMDKCATCADAFGDEWVKRMRERYPTEAFITIYVEAYEKYLTDPQVLELIAFYDEQKSGHAATMPPELTAQLNSIMPSLMGEISGRCVQVATKLGTEIGAEIQAEHPEYFNVPPSKGEAPKS